LPVEVAKGLTVAARAHWSEQTAALEQAGRLTPARVELVTAWARALDARERASRAWRAAGEPESELGSMGQERRHHLAVAAERAETQLASLSAKTERSAARREPKRREGLPIGATYAEIDGEPVVVGEDGRLLVHGQDGRWRLTRDEADHDAGGVMLRWVADDGLPRFHDPPPKVHRGESMAPTGMRSATGHAAAGFPSRRRWSGAHCRIR
jgi:hypothetical protein